MKNKIDKERRRSMNVHDKFMLKLCYKVSQMNYLAIYSLYSNKLKEI
jgi:hypothetical protein